MMRIMINISISFSMCNNLTNRASALKIRLFYLIKSMLDSIKKMIHIVFRLDLLLKNGKICEKIKIFFFFLLLEKNFYISYLYI